MDLMERSVVGNERPNRSLWSMKSIRRARRQRLACACWLIPSMIALWSA